jgi:hypothetical protein
MNARFVMRRIITGLNDKGLSTFTAVEKIEKSDLPRVWEGSLSELPPWVAGQGLLFDPASSGMSYDPVPRPGRLMCWVNFVPPEKTLADDDPSWRVPHKQRSVDIVYVMDPVVLVLEDGEMEVMSGDVIIQRATVHAFRNPGAEPAQLMGFSWGVDVP